MNVYVPVQQFWHQYARTLRAEQLQLYAVSGQHVMCHWHAVHVHVCMHACMCSSAHTPCHNASLSTAPACLWTAGVLEGDHLLAGGTAVHQQH
jgi:hypothetical protein